VAESIEPREDGAEGEREQEAEQDLHTGEQHTQLLQQFGEVQCAGEFRSQYQSVNEETD